MAKKEEKPIAVITHWYDKLNVAVLDLKGALAVGDRIKVKRGDSEFEDSVVSMQIDHKEVSSAKKGKDVAVKLSQKAHDGAFVYKVE